jgi:hypothetical protein
VFHQLLSEERAESLANIWITTGSGYWSQNQASTDTTVARK